MLAREEGQNEVEHNLALQRTPPHTRTEERGLVDIEDSTLARISF